MVAGRDDDATTRAPGLPTGRSGDAGDSGDPSGYTGAAEDAAWVEAARAGDEQAFGRLFDRWFDPVFDVAWRIVRNRDTAAEVAQDVFLVAWQGLDGLEQPGSFGGWVRRIARNRALNRLDRERRSTPDDEQAAVALDSSAPDVDLSAALGERDQRELVWAAASALGERDASLLDLHLRHGFGAAEIADELGVTTNNAHQLLHRLKGKLGGAIQAWVLWRGVRRDCDGLDRAVSTAGITTFGADAVQVIARHVKGCDGCSDRQQLRLSPEALFAAMPIVLAPPLLKAEAAAALGEAGVPMAGSTVSAAGGGAGGDQPSSHGDTAGDQLGAEPEAGSDVVDPSAEQAAGPDPTDADPADVDPSGADSPTADSPGVDTPGVDTPGVETAGVDSSVDTAGVESSGVESSEVDAEVEAAAHVEAGDVGTAGIEDGPAPDLTQLPEPAGDDGAPIAGAPALASNADPSGDTRSRPRVLVLVGMLALLFLAAGLAATLWGGEGGDPVETAQDRPTTTQTSTTDLAPPTTSSAPGTDPEVRDTTTSSATEAADDGRTATTTVTEAPVVVSDPPADTAVTTAAPSSPTTTAPPAPTITVFRVTALGDRCGPTADAGRKVDVVWQSTGGTSAILSGGVEGTSSHAATDSTSRCAVSGDSFTLTVSGPGGPSDPETRTVQ